MPTSSVGVGSSDQIAQPHKIAQGSRRTRTAPRPLPARAGPAPLRLVTLIVALRDDVLRRPLIVSIWTRADSNDRHPPSAPSTPVTLSPLPLDHLFHDPQFRVVSVERLPHIGSDHFPILFELALHRTKRAGAEPSEPDSQDLREARELASDSAVMDREPIGADWEKQG